MNKTFIEEQCLWVRNKMSFIELRSMDDNCMGLESVWKASSRLESYRVEGDPMYPFDAAEGYQHSLHHAAALSSHDPSICSDEKLSLARLMLYESFSRQRCDAQADGNEATKSLHALELLRAQDARQVSDSGFETVRAPKTTLF